MKFFILSCVMNLSVLLFSSHALADGGKKKVQEVNFEGDDVDGVVRRPDGMFLVQKKSIDFVPLYRVRDSFDQNIRESVEQLR